MTVRKTLTCPGCGRALETYRNPLLTVDIIIRLEGRGIVLIERRNPPLGWALPGGFVDYGETLEQAAVREAMEETSLLVENLRQFRAYSDPSRDPRHHTVSMVFLGTASGTPRAADDALNIGVFSPGRFPDELVFDHGKILADFLVQEAGSFL